MKITDIITTTEQPCVTLFRGIWLETIGFQKNVRKHIYEFRDLSDWQTHAVLDRIILVHHNCNKDCKVERKCDMHPKECHLQCQTTKASVVHSTRGEFLVEKNYKNLSS